MQPILLDLGFLQLRYYGLMYAISFIFALWITHREFARKNYPLNRDQVQNFVLLVFLCSLVFARLYYVIFNWPWYFGGEAPWYEFLAVWHGGLAIHGGILGGIVAIAIFSKKYQVSFLGLTDIAALVVILGQAIGRIGNLMNGDAHGIPTDLPWGLVFPYGPASIEFPGQALHPVMIYEGGLNLLAFLILWNLRKRGFKDGFLSALYLIFYSLIRSFVSLFRADDLFVWGVDKWGVSHYFFNQNADLAYGLRAPHLISLIGVVVGLGLILSLKLYRRKLKTETAHGRNHTEKKAGAGHQKKKV